MSVWRQPGFWPRRFSNIRSASASTVLALLGCAPGFDDPDTRLEDAACLHPILASQWASLDVRCGLLSALELRSAPDGLRVALPFAVLSPRTDSSEDLPPVLYLEGGPGGSTAGFTTYAGSAFIQSLNHPVILFEQRGAPLSTPALECGGRLSECRDSYKVRGIRLEGYSTSESAKDVCALIDLLGYDQVSLHGISYGTLLAQEVMRLSPGQIHSAWLDGVVPSDAPWTLNLGPNFVHALDRVFTVCDTNAACHAKYPDPKAVFDELLGAWPLGSSFTADEAIDFLFKGLYDPRFVVGVPGLIYAIREGRVQAYMEAWRSYSLLGSTLPRREPEAFALGMYFAVNCNDNVQYFELSEAWATHEKLHPVLRGHFIGIIELDREECDRWPHRPKEVKSPVTALVPTLVTAGGFDPITPVEGAERVARNLTLGQFVQLGDASHGLLFDDCAQKMWKAFLAEPSSPVSTSCALNSSVTFFTE